MHKTKGMLTAVQTIFFAVVNDANETKDGNVGVIVTIRKKDNKPKCKNYRSSIEIWLARNCLWPMVKGKWKGVRGTKGIPQWLSTRMFDNMEKQLRRC